MNLYRIDLHTHTKEVSSCGQVPARRLVELYHQAGYDGVVITDHFYEGYFESLTGLTWNQKIDCFLSGYRNAAEVGAKLGFHVLLGAEFRFTENNNDYLMYGFEENFLLNQQALYSLSLAQFYQHTTNTNILIYQAHPFRSGMIPANPRYLHGVEVFNGNPRHNSRNQLAYEYAIKHGLKMSSGSDFHQPQDLGSGGIMVTEEITAATQLTRLLREDRVLGYLGFDTLAIP